MHCNTSGYRNTAANTCSVRNSSGCRSKHVHNCNSSSYMNTAAHPSVFQTAGTLQKTDATLQATGTLNVVCILTICVLGAGKHKYCSTNPSINSPVCRKEAAASSPINSHSTLGLFLECSSRELVLGLVQYSCRQHWAVNGPVSCL